MGKYVGVDWASKGWFGVILMDDGSWTTDHFPTVWSIWKRHSDATRIFIDIPIGLPDEDRRVCDVEAKQELSPRGASVYYTPIRDGVYQQNLEAAKTLNEQVGYSIQNQAWSAVPRIREVDEFLDMYPGARDRVFETHPELCFYAFNDRQPVVSKHTEEGIRQRKSLLESEYPDALDIFETAREQYLTPAYASFLNARTDILDGLVAAVTAQRPMNELGRLPEGNNPPTDDRGLPKQIVFPRDDSQTRLTTLAETHQE